jgi:hypothetical protein
VARRFTDPDIDRYGAIHVEPGRDEKSVQLMAANGFAVMVAELDATLRRDGFEQMSFDPKLMPRSELSNLDYPDLARFVSEARDNGDTLRAWLDADLFCAAVQGMATIAGDFPLIGLRLVGRSLALMVYRNDRSGPFFSARMPIAPRPDEEEYTDEVACTTVRHEYLTKALKGFEDAAHVEISVPRDRAPLMVRSRSLTVVVMPADVRPDYWEEALMRVTDVSYANKVSYGDYCNEEMRAAVQLDPGDDPREAAAMARRVVSEALEASAEERSEKQSEMQEKREAERRASMRRKVAQLRAAGWSDETIREHYYIDDDDLTDEDSLEGLADDGAVEAPEGEPGGEEIVSQEPAPTEETAIPF